MTGCPDGPGAPGAEASSTQGGEGNTTGIASATGTVSATGIVSATSIASTTDPSGGSSSGFTSATQIDGSSSSDLASTTGSTTTDSASGTTDGSTTDGPSTATNPGYCSDALGSSTSDGASSSDGGNGGPGLCGNGVVDPGEDCDDGNLSPGDGCEPDCTVLVPQPIWTDMVDGDGMDSANAIALLPSGDLVVVGHLEDAGGERDVWVARYDLAGNQLWSHSHDLGLGLDDEALDVVVGSAAAPLSIIGSVAVPLPGAPDNVDILLAELDDQGNVLASYTYGGADPGADRGTALAIDCLGDRVLVGHVATAAQGDEIWLAKVDDMGSLLWEQLIGGQAADDDTAEDIAILPDGSFVAVGAIHDANVPHMWISRRSPDGAELWTQIVHGGWGANIAHAVAMAPDGSLYVGGGLGNIDSGSMDRWVGHYDAMGGELWTTTLLTGSLSFERVLGLAVTSNDSVITIGDLNQPTSTDILIQRVDAFDTYSLDFVAGGAMLDDWGNDVMVLPSGGFVAVGQLAEPDWGDAWVRRYGT